MRLTILAGLIAGASLAMGASLKAHAKPKPIPANSAIQIRIVAPWSTATNSSGGPILNKHRVTSRAGDAEAMT